MLCTINTKHLFSQKKKKKKKKNNSIFEGPLLNFPCLRMSPFVKYCSYDGESLLKYAPLSVLQEYKVRIGVT
jgi:hypothetical protein